MRSIYDDQLNAPPEILGSRDIGIDYDAVNELCQVDPLPKTINVLRQQMIARVVVTAFFEEHLADDAERRAAPARYLSREMVSGIPEVVYTRSAATLR